jgi:hypothetical protein
MTPQWSARLSRTIGSLLLLLCAVNYTTSLLSRDLAEVVSVSLSAIGILAALSAISFSFSPCINEPEDRNRANYSGEKFLHSCLMIIQTLFAKYVFSGVTSLDLVKRTGWLLLLSGAVFTILVLAFSAFAVLAAHWGFDELNKLLWDRYERRLPK